MEREKRRQTAFSLASVDNPMHWGHSFSTYARRGEGGVKQMRTNAYKGGGGVDT